MKIGCVLLAAGSGRRFGGDKLHFVLDGISMAERACRLHAGIPYAARVLVMREGDKAMRALAEQYGFLPTVNTRADEGIGTSAAAGIGALQRCNDLLDGALFAVCDQPYLTAGTVCALLDGFRADPSRIVAPVHAGSRGNPVLFPRALFGAFSALHADVGGSAVIRTHAELLSLVPVSNPRELADIDYQNETRNDPC